MQRLIVQVMPDTIVLINEQGKKKEFPRCGIKNLEAFVYEMLRLGKMDDLA